MITYRKLFCLLAVVSLLVAGCMSAKGRVEAPELNAEKMAQDAMDLYDKDGDGFINSTEVKESPALKFALEDIDSNADKKLSQDELLERFNIYVDTAVGLQSITMHVMHRGGGFMDATVRLVPEPFMADYIDEAEGEVIDPGNGLVQIASIPGEPGVRVGMYRVEVTSDDVNVKAKYNTETNWGIEVPPITSKATSSPMVFTVK